MSTREEQLAIERAHAEIGRKRVLDQNKKAASDKIAKEKFEKEQAAEAKAAEQARDSLNRQKSWPAHEKVKPLALKALARYQKAIEELAAADLDLQARFFDLYHTSPKTDGTLFSDSPLSPNRITQWFRLNMFKLGEKRWRWITRTGENPALIKTLAEEAALSVEWCSQFKSQEKKLDIGKDEENIF